VTAIPAKFVGMWLNDLSCMQYIAYCYRVACTAKRNKSLFSFLRQLTTWHCPHVRLRAAAPRLLLTAGGAAIGRYFLPAGPPATKPQQLRAAAG